jgi:flagellar hook-length control protein FliK
MLIGETVGNGAEQSAAAADRSAAASNAARGLGLRPTPAQVPFQPAEQVKVQIQQMVKSGADRIQIKLSPASLGRVEIALEISPDKAVQAIVYAEKPETLDMLERDARVLQQAFEEAGMKFGSDGLTFKHGQSGDADTELADGSGNTEDGAANGDEPEAGDSADNDSPRRRQHDGMLDLEI